MSERLTGLQSAVRLAGQTHRAAITPLQAGQHQIGCVMHETCHQGYAISEARTWHEPSLSAPNARFVTLKQGEYHVLYGNLDKPLH